MITSLGNFFQSHASAGRRGGDDFEREGGQGLSLKTKAGIAAGWAALTTGAGAAWGASNAAKDVVTIEQVPYSETVRVKTGSHIEYGCSQYHYGYDVLTGEFGFHYGPDPNCSQSVDDYTDMRTGRTLYKEVKHHSVGLPHSMLQGALLGLGAGVATGVLGVVLSEALKKG